MKVADAQQAYYDHSGALSEQLRKAMYAGIAVVWIFREVDGDRPGISSGLIWALGLMVTSLVLDIGQYISATVAWGHYHRQRERVEADEDHDERAPESINYASNFFMISKVLVGMAGLIVLAINVYLAV